MEVGSISSGAYMPEPPSMEDMFSEIDANGDGVLQAEEFAAVAQTMSEMTGETVDSEEIFSELDEDGDGVLSIDEMPEMAPPPPPPPQAQVSGSQTFSGSGGLLGGLGGITGGSSNMGLDALLAAAQTESDSEDEDEEGLSAAGGIENNSFQSFLEALKQAENTGGTTASVDSLLELATSSAFAGVDVVA